MFYFFARVFVLKYKNKGLYNTLDLQKKGRTGVRLNLSSQPNKRIINCYSPRFVIKYREYYIKKEILKITKKQTKFDRKIKQIANTFRRKQEEAKKLKRKEEREAKITKK
jgi:hypothetical protein